jgi:hypothetical protein
MLYLLVHPYKTEPMHKVVMSMSTASVHSEIKWFHYNETQSQKCKQASMQKNTGVLQGKAKGMSKYH